MAIDVRLPAPRRLPGVPGARLERVAFRVAGPIALLLSLCLPLLLVRCAVAPAAPRAIGWDFRAFYEAGRAYLEHRDPYPQPTLAAMTTQENFVYPLPVAAAFVPWALLPLPVAIASFLVLSVLCLVLALQVLGVRDWRCHAAVLFTLPAQSSVRLGTLMPALTLLLALAWRYRDRRAVAVPALAVLAVAKLFLWPLGVWFLATRRASTAVLAAVVAVVAVLLTALPYGFGIVRDYPRVLGAVSAFESSFSYSPFSLALSLGAPRELAHALALGFGVGVLAAVVVAGRQGRDQLAFRLAIAAALALSPIVWGHYFVLLAVPLALLRPRFSPLWLALAWLPVSLLPALMLRPLLIAPALVLAAAQLGLLWRPRPRRVPLASALALGALAGATLGAGAIAAPRADRVGPLEPLTGVAGANGTAFVRVTGRAGVCWQVWSDGVRSSRVQGRLDTGATLLPLGNLHLDAEGNGAGCAALPGPTTRHLLTQLKHWRDRYRFVLTTPLRPQGVLAGRLYDPVHPT